MDVPGARRKAVCRRREMSDWVAEGDCRLLKRRVASSVVLYDSLEDLRPLFAATGPA
jgi:hypothetical protein